MSVRNVFAGRHGSVTQGISPEDVCARSSSTPRSRSRSPDRDDPPLVTRSSATPGAMELPMAVIDPMGFTSAERPMDLEPDGTFLRPNPQIDPATTEPPRFRGGVPGRPHG